MTSVASLFSFYVLFSHAAVAMKHFATPTRLVPAIEVNVETSDISTISYYRDSDDYQPNRSFNKGSSVLCYLTPSYYIFRNI
jgi:hypothetical protein